MWEGAGLAFCLFHSSRPIRVSRRVVELQQHLGLRLKTCSVCCVCLLTWKLPYNCVTAAPPPHHTFQPPLTTHNSFFRPFCSYDLVFPSLSLSQQLDRPQTSHFFVQKNEADWSWTGSRKIRRGRRLACWASEYSVLEFGGMQQLLLKVVAQRAPLCFVCF